MIAHHVRLPSPARGVRRFRPRREPRYRRRTDQQCPIRGGTTTRVSLRVSFRSRFAYEIILRRSGRTWGTQPDDPRIPLGEPPFHPPCTEGGCPIHKTQDRSHACCKPLYDRVAPAWRYWYDCRLPLGASRAVPFMAGVAAGVSPADGPRGRRPLRHLLVNRRRVVQVIELPVLAATI